MSSKFELPRSFKQNVFIRRSTGNVSYQASLSAGTACSVALPPTGNATFVPTADDSVEIRLVVRVENHPSLVNGAINWVGAGFTYANGLMWVGAQALTAINNPNTPYSSYNVNATVSYRHSSLKNMLSVNQLFKLIIFLKICLLFN